MRRFFASFAAALALLAAPAAQAQAPAWTTTSVHLRAGPERFYPVVAVLGPRTAVTVFACVPDYVWCDVAAGPLRGWVRARHLAYSYREREVLLPGIAAAVGIAIAAFIVDDYWHDHYLDRPWYADRHRWVRPPPQPHQPLAPPPRRVQPVPPPPPRAQPQPLPPRGQLAPPPARVRPAPRQEGQAVPHGQPAR